METTSNINMLASEPNNNHSRRSLVSEHVGAQITARNLLVGGVLNSGPPLSLKENFVGQPVRDGLLLHGGALQEGGDPDCQLGLAVVRNTDGATKRGNVRFIHEHRLYKRTCNYVNKPSCMTAHKDACILPFMPPKKTPKQSQTPRDDLRIGRDGRTAAARLEEGYEEWKKSVGGTQERLAELANIIMGYSEDDPERLQQQEISQFIKGASDLSKSARASAIAEVIGVRPAWLQHGSGNKYDVNRLTAKQRQALKDLVGFDDKG